MTTSTTATAAPGLLASLGLADRTGFEPRLVTATVVSAGVDLARCQVQGPDGPYEAVLPVTEWYRRKRWTVGQTLVALQVDDGPLPTLSVLHRRFVPALVESIAPAVRDGRVRVMRVVRVPGVRAKVAVAPTTAGEDAKGALIGPKASRVQWMRAQAMGERFEVCLWSEDPETLLRHAMEVVDVRRVEVTDGTATVWVPAHQLHAAAGGGGLTVTLAERLTGLTVTLAADGE